MTTVTWELPVGKGRRFMNSGGWKNAILGGWELVASQHFMTGPPVTITFSRLAQCLPAGRFASEPAEAE